MTDSHTLKPVVEALNELLHTRELEEGRELPPDSPTLADRRRQVDTAFWKAARKIVMAAIPEGHVGKLCLGPDGLRFIDHGLFDHESLAGVEGPDASAVDGVWLLHESLNAVLDDVLRRDALGEFQADLDSLQRDIKLWPETHLAHIQYRDGKVRELLGDSPRCTHALKLFAEIDEKLEQYKQLEAKGRTGGALTEDERRTQNTMKHFIASRREQLSSILAPVTDKTAVVQTELAAAAMAASEAAEASVAHLIELQGKRRALEQQVMEQQSGARRITRAEVERALARELDAVASLLRLAARYVHWTECAVPVDDKVSPVSADDAADAVDHLLQFDPRLIDNPLAARFGPPDLLLAPGVGDGVFDASRNRWIVPQRCLGGPVVSLAHAAILYRLNVDSKEMSNTLLSSYREGIPANRGIRSNLKLRTALIRDYIRWMSTEAVGEEGMERETREWFEQHIAPDKTQPWLPSQYRTLNARQLTQNRAELETKPPSPDQQHRLGAITWLLANGDEEGVQRALGYFEKAIQLAPDHRAGTYSAATASMHLKKFQQAITHFRRFTELSPTGWWARKAVELCGRCR